MIKLLLNIRNSRKTAIRVKRDADILDIAVSRRQSLSRIQDIMQILNGKVQLSLTMPLQLIFSCLDHSILESVDILRIKENNADYKTKWIKLEQFIYRHKTILLIDADDLYPYNWYLWLKKVKRAGFYGIMLERYSGNLLSSFQKDAIVCIEKFVHDVKCHGLTIGLAGALEAPDVSRLLPCNPDILGFSLAKIGGLKKNRKMGENGLLIRSLIPSEKNILDAKVATDSRTDRILVADFILPMHIGAYSYERDAQQRIRFNVAVDVTRVSIDSEDIRYIFSYDLILDRIRRLASLGHIALVETLAERIATFVLRYQQVQRVMVRVEKLDLGSGSVGVEIVRKKKTSFFSEKDQCL